jgi:RNA polymerase sigma-70 factor (ECF subfamily)
MRDMVNKKSVGQNHEFVKSLYENSYRELFAFLLRRATTREQAQDMSQETYIRMMRIDRIDLIEQPKAYLFRIAANTVYEMRIKSNRHFEKVTFPFDEVEDVASPDEHDPQLHFERKEAVSQLEFIIKDLPPIYQSVLLMRKRDGLTHIEISDKLQISIHTVRKYLTRAVSECRKASIADEQ